MIATAGYSLGRVVPGGLSQADTVLEVSACSLYGMVLSLPLTQT